ncbi:MAG TPA: GntR family transcriptional regulator [Gaiellaceae bacterium]|jgi:DNA-binding GntR family transcriptional regulator|nr:GntR family transcriptional regulator [Gaiellaceae bacterium]
MSPLTDTPRKSLTEKAYDHVRTAILRGEMPVGTVIAEARVAEELGISKTPLRQALQLLRTEGLLEVGPRKQLVVRGFSPEHRNEILRIRESLEELAIETAVAVLSDDEIDLLHLSLLRQKRAVDAGDEDEFLELDERFHITIAQAANLPIVARLLEQIRGFARLMRLGRTQPPEHLREVLAEHQRIVEAIEQRDVGRARRELHDHLHHWDHLVAANQDAPPGP